MAERLERLEAKVAGLAERIDAKFGGLAQDVSQFRNDMHVLHEDLVDRIAALAPDYAPIRREFQQGDAEVKESLLRRIEPLEAAERTRRRPRS
jgi:hypothetical protein